MDFLFFCRTYKNVAILVHTAVFLSSGNKPSTGTTAQYARPVVWRLIDWQSLAISLFDEPTVERNQLSIVGRFGVRHLGKVASRLHQLRCIPPHPRHHNSIRIDQYSVSIAAWTPARLIGGHFVRSHWTEPSFGSRLAEAMMDVTCSRMKTAEGMSLRERALIPWRQSRIGRTVERPNTCQAGLRLWRRTHGYLAVLPRDPSFGEQKWKARRGVATYRCFQFFFPCMTFPCSHRSTATIPHSTVVFVPGIRTAMRDRRDVVIKQLTERSVCESILNIKSFYQWMTSHNPRLPNS